MSGPARPDHDPDRDGPGRSRDDPAARNRATPRRHVPGRPALGAGVTRAVLAVTALLLVAVTALLVAVALLAR